MRPDKHRLLTLATVGIVVLSACRSSAPGSASTDSAATPAPRADSAPGSGAVSTAVRSDSVVLRTDKRQYKAGEQVTLTFENKSASSYTFNPCNRSVEREDGGAWTALPDEGRICTMEAWILEARGTRSGTTALPTPLAAGRYRIVVRMTSDSPAGSPGLAAVSDPITVS